MSNAPIPFPTSSHPDDPPPQRRAQYYQTNSSQPFSRSAARRESVMALGSIKHLQHQYVKLGLGARPLGTRALPFGGTTMSEEPEELEEEAGDGKRRKSRLPLLGISLARVQGIREEDLPPSPVKPNVERKMPWEIKGESGRSVKDEKDLRREVLASLEGVCERWGLISSLSLAQHLRRRSSRSSYSYSESDPARLPSPEPDSRPFSALSIQSPEPGSPSSSTSLVLDLLQTTTAAIRNVQLYVVSLPSDAFGAKPTPPTTPNPSPSPGLTAFPFKPNPHRRDSSSTEPPANTTTDPNPLHTLRQSSLAVLGALKSLELQYRIPLPPSSPLSPSIAEDELQSPGLEASTSSDSTPSASSSGEASEVGFEYKPVTLEELVEEARVVRDYVEVVDRVLFRDREKSGKSGGRRASLRAAKEKEEEAEKREKKQGHRRSRKISVEDMMGGRGEVPIVMEPESLEEESDESEDEVPEWALMPEGFGESASFLEHIEKNPPPKNFSSLERTHAVLAAHLPPHLAEQLPSPGSTPYSHSLFLEALSDGYLLCHAYNLALRASSKPFGFIQDREIHELPSTNREDGNAEGALRRSMSGGGGEEKKVGATFRRVENLRVWSAALKFRYLISFDPPKQKGTSPPPRPSTGGFDAKLVGRKEEGWEEMLKMAVEKWVMAVVGEKVM